MLTQPLASQLLDACVRRQPLHLLAHTSPSSPMTAKVGSSTLVMEEVEGPKIAPDTPTEQSNSCCDPTDKIQRHYASSDDESNFHGGHFMPTEQDFELPEGSMQGDEGGIPSQDSPSPYAQADPFYHDWPYWNSPVRESDAAETKFSQPS